MRLSMASLDPLALDTLATRFMGFDPGEVLYLSAMKEAGMGQGDIEGMNIMGPGPEDIRFKFKAADGMIEPYCLS